MTVRRTGEWGMSGKHVDRDLAFEIIQIFAEGIPVPIFVVDIFVEHAAQILRPELCAVQACGGTGAQEAPQSPMTMLVTP